MAIVLHNAQAVREPAANLRKRGYWNPQGFPVVAAFSAMPKAQQDDVVITCRLRGLGAAIECVPRTHLHT